MEYFLLFIEFLSYALLYVFIYLLFLIRLIIINQISLNKVFHCVKDGMVGWVSFIPR